MKKQVKNKQKVCCICKKYLTMSDKAKTCSYSCAGKLAWKKIRAEYY